MFSKALYKQSWKANWIIWLAVTIVSSFILMIIMLMSGGDGIGSLTSSVKEAFVKDSLEASFKGSSINYHYVGYQSLEAFDEAFIFKYSEQIKDNPYQAPDASYIETAYVYAVTMYQVAIDHEINLFDPTLNNQSDAYLEIFGAAMFTLNPNGTFDSLYESYELNSTPLAYDMMYLVESISGDQMLEIWTTGNVSDDLYDVIYTKERMSYKMNRSRNASSIFTSGSILSIDGRQMIIDMLNDSDISEAVYDGFGFNYNYIKNLTTIAILNFQSRMDYEISLLNPLDYESDIAYKVKLNEIKESIEKDISALILSLLPESLGNSMADMQNYNVYIMTVGNMYFKIVGLLISIVYVIIVGINLIAGQVDSGSMAYVLSTGTKRNTITFTQMIFLTSSTLFIYMVTSMVAVILFYVAPPTSADITVVTILMFNLGAFLVTITLGSIIYLSSCIFNRVKHAMALGGGFAVLTVVVTILGMFASDSTPAMMRMDALKIFNYFSLVTLFDINSMLENSINYIINFGILALVSMICFVVGMMVFKKKDLPL